MILRKIFTTEFAYLVRRVSTWLYLIVLLAFTVAINLVTTPGDGVYPNNTFHITSVTVIGSLIWVIMGAAVAGEAAARDIHTRMYTLIYAAPVSKGNYLGGRYLAALAVNALLILSLPAGVLLSFYLPGIDQDPLQPFRPVAYLNVYFLIALPVVFIATTLQFAFALLSRKIITSYIASLLLALFPLLVATSAAKLFGNWDLIKLLDPIGIAGIVGSELATWTPIEKNTRLLTLEGMFMWNRVLWLSAAAVVLLITYSRFSFSSPVNISRWSRFKYGQTDKAATETVITIATAIYVPKVQRNFGFATALRQMLVVGWKSFMQIVRNPLGVTLVGAIVIASSIFGSYIISEFGIPLLPTTQQVLAYLAPPVSNINTPWVVIPLFIMYLAGELVWRERDSRLNDIADAAPVADWVLITGKFSGLCLIIVVWMALLMAGGIVMQLSQDYDELQISLYLQVLFGLQLADYLLFALLAFAIHVVVNQKYIGYLVTLLLFSFMAFPGTFRVEHNMLIFGASPGWWYTDMRGFGQTLGPWLWFKIYWAAWALLLAVAAGLFWTRGKEQSFKYRFLVARQKFRGATAKIAITGTVILILTGGFIFYNTNILNEYVTAFDVIKAKAEYERLYGRYRNLAQPQLTATKLNVEIYPEQQVADIRGTYTLVNKDTAAIDSIHLGNISGIELLNITFSMPAAAVLADKELSYYIYDLKQSLQPGDSLQLSFKVRYEQQGFAHDGASVLIAENGTYFTNYDLLPSIGYQRLKEINDPVIRKKHKLAERPQIPSLYDRDAGKKSFSTDHDTFEAIIGTAKNEVAVAPGALQRTWTTGNRSYFHYKTDAPLGGEYAFLSGKYAVRESRWNHVVISMYYYPGHASNIDRMLHSIRESLKLFTEEFGPYPYGHLTIIERAGYGGGLSAEASMIDYGEQFALMNPDYSSNGFDLPYYIMAHEVSHQWWGVARLEPANVEGAGVLIEGLAVYSGMQVLAKNYGNGHLQKYIDFLHSSYKMPRSLASATLLQANEPFLYYRKGGLAMYALSRYIGKKKVNGSLKSLLEKHNSGELPRPTTLDLYRELKKVTPDTLNYLLHDLFMKNTYWRLKTKQLAAKQTGTGNWQVTLKVQAQKVVVDSAGNENEVPMNDWLEIGIYEEAGGKNIPLYLKMHHITSGEQIIKVTVPREPDYGGIDPNYLMIDVRLEDNVKQLDKSDKALL